MPHSFLYYCLLTVCLLLAVGVAFSAWRRPQRRWRAARVLAGLLAAAGLWLTAYPPRRRVPAPRVAAIVLTPGYHPDTLRRLRQQLGPATRVWHYAPERTTPPPADTPTIASLLTLRELLPGLRHVHVLGGGLPAASLPQLGPLRLVPHAPPAFTGFRAARWNRQLELGQALVLEGFFGAARPAGPVWVRLHAAGAPRDSVQLPAGQGAFRLRYTPKVAGRLVAGVSAGPARAPLAAEPVPAEVLPTRPLRVLLLAGTPSFELKFLKNHLAARQHAVAWRTGLSRGLTQTEFSNHAATDLSRLTPSLLARYDVLVVEAGALAALPTPELRALRDAQRLTGLGVLLLAEPKALPPGLPGRAAARVVPVSVGVAATRPQALAWEAAPPAAAAVPATLALTSAARALVVQHATGRAVAASYRQGAGATVLSTLPETFPWLLENTAPVYDSYWSLLLTAAARPAVAAARWHVADNWPRPHHPVILQFEGTFPAAVPVVADALGASRAQVALRQDPRLPEWSTATYWPTLSGWQQIQLPQLAPHWFYVFQPTDWLGPEWHRRQQGTLPWLASSRGGVAAVSTSLVPWPAWWFFTLFVLAAGFLWLEEKL